MRELGSVLVLFHSSRAPTNDEWDSILAMLERTMRAHGAVQIIVLTEGGPPSATQRAALTRILAGGKSRSAVLTQSKAARAIVTALRWWNPTIVSFSPDDLASAMAFLRIEPERKGTIERTLVELRDEVARSLPKVGAE
jgi:hypothetical protein